MVRQEDGGGDGDSPPPRTNIPLLGKAGALDVGHFVIPILKLNRSTLPDALDAGHFVVPIFELNRSTLPDALDAGHFVIPIFELNRSTLPNASDAGHFVVPILELLVVGHHCVFPPETILFYIRASGRIMVLTPTTGVPRAGPRMLVLFEQ